MWKSQRDCQWERACFSCEEDFMTDSVWEHVLMRHLHCVESGLSELCDRDWVTEKLNNLDMNFLVKFFIRTGQSPENGWWLRAEMSVHALHEWLKTVFCELILRCIEYTPRNTVGKGNDINVFGQPLGIDHLPFIELNGCTSCKNMTYSYRLPMQGTLRSIVNPFSKLSHNKMVNRLSSSCLTE